MFAGVRGKAGDSRHAVLMALEEAVRDMRQEPTPTLMFAGIMAALESASSRTCAELLSLLLMALPKVAPSVARRKFDLAAAILLDVLKRNSSDVTVQEGKKRGRDDEDEEMCTTNARRAALCLGSLLASQEATEAAWKAPSKTRCLDALFLAASDKRPKVRKAARLGFVDAIKAHQNCRSPSRFGANRVESFLKDGLAELIAKSAEPPPSAFHSLAFIEDIGAKACAPADAFRLAELVAELLAKRSELHGASVDERALRFDAAALNTIASVMKEHVLDSPKRIRNFLVHLPASRSLASTVEACAVAWSKAAIATIDLTPFLPEDEGVARLLAEKAFAAASDDRARIRYASADLAGACCRQLRKKSDSVWLSYDALKATFRDTALKILNVLWTQNASAPKDAAKSWFDDSDLLFGVRLLASRRDDLLVAKGAHNNDDFFVDAATRLGVSTFSKAAPPF